MIAAAWRDVRYAARALGRAPGFAVLAVVIVAVGVGANTAIFSVVNAALLRPLPYPRDVELVLVSGSDRTTGQPTFSATPANFLDWRARNRSFTGMAGFRQSALTWSGTDHPERIAGALVSVNFFDVLEVRPAIGRGLAAADGERGAPRVAVISDAMWRNRFGGRPDILGQIARLNDEPHTIVGVMAPGVEYPDKTEIWTSPHWPVPDDPLSPGADPSANRSHGYFSVLARLAPGVSFDAARADMNRVALALEALYPDDNRNAGVALTRMRTELVGGVRATMLLLFAAVGLLLLIATANISGLLMARATLRQQEIAIRAALGATRGRIVAQLLAESILLAALGGGAGVLLAMWLVTPLVALSPSDLAVAGAVTIDWPVLLFGLGCSALVGVLFGLAPALQLSRVDVIDDLKHSARGGVGVGQRRLRAALVTGEIALSLVLLVTAGVTVRSFIRVQEMAPGFEPNDVLTVTLSAPPNRYADEARRAEYWDRILASLRGIPGVEAAGAISRLPLLPGNSTRGLFIRSLPADAQPTAQYRTASADYFKVMAIPILSGRAIEDADRENRPAVAVVSSAAARRFWPGRDAVGETFQINVPGPDYAVVGIAGDVRSASLEVGPEPTIYVPFRQDAFPFMTFVMKTPASAGAMSSAVRTAIWLVDRDVPVGPIRTMDDTLSNSLSRRRFSVTLLSLFGITAVMLAAVGLYGVLAFIVSQRRREIGVRIALGATARDVIGDVLGQGLRLAGLGLILGLALAMVTTRLMAAFLFGTSPTDAVTFAAAAALLAIIAAAASLVPALRASRVDPLVALRDD